MTNSTFATRSQTIETYSVANKKRRKNIETHSLSDCFKYLTLIVIHVSKNNHNLSMVEAFCTCVGLGMYGRGGKNPMSPEQCAALTRKLFHQIHKCTR